MSLSSVLDVAIGLMVVFYLLSSVISLVTQLINETFETRGKALEENLLRLLGDKKLGELVSLPQIQALQPIRYKKMMSVFTSAIEPKKLEKVPVSTLVDSFFDISGLTANKEAELLQLAELIDKLPDSESKTAFINWINQGVTDMKDLRERTTVYFNGVLEQAADTFRARARSVVIMLSLAITLLFGTDAIQLAQTLWHSAELRAAAAAQAQMIMEREGVNADMADIIDGLALYSIKIGWWQTQQFPDPGAPVMDWVSFVFFKVLGLGITTMAISQGSSFWYDLLKKLTKTEKVLPDAKG